jgi:hypothetical protein
MMGGYIGLKITNIHINLPEHRRNGSDRQGP